MLRFASGKRPTFISHLDCCSSDDQRSHHDFNSRSLLSSKPRPGRLKNLPRSFRCARFNHELAGPPLERYPHSELASNLVDLDWCPLVSLLG